MLTLNAGSSSLKVGLYACGADDPVRIATGQVAAIGSSRCRLEWRGSTARTSSSLADAGHAAALSEIMAVVSDTEDRPITAVGHRITHGGLHHIEPEAASSAVLDELEELVPLAPLHLPHNLLAVRELATAHVGLPQVLCYDTAFHGTMPPQARHFALPQEYADLGIVRYGFHGLSYEYIAHALPSIIGPEADGRVIVAHLGAGASLCAMHGRRSIATTMAFTPLDGLPMASRCGALDPGVILYLLRSGHSLDDLTDLLYNRSGLLGVSGLSGDMRELLGSSDSRAAEAVAMFTYRAREAVGALAADMGGLDALVFTGGIGEHEPTIRAQICTGLSWLGVEVDLVANDVSQIRFDAPSSRVSLLTIPTDEGHVIAGHTWRLVNSS